MKKALLFILGIMTVVTVQATNEATAFEKTILLNRYDDAVSFVERGVQFHVFLNGDFEFDNPNNRYYSYNNRRIRTHNLRVFRDYEGRIKRIGSNYIRYDYRGNVTRIGTIRIYYRKGLVKRVGNLKISYNNWGDPYFYGSVHRDYYDSDFRFSVNIGPIFNYNDRFFYGYQFKNNYRKFREDRNYYYYKVRPNGKVGTRGKIIKRRKAGVSNQRNRKYNKREQSSNRRYKSQKDTSKKRATTSTRVAPKKRTQKKVEKRKIEKKQDRRRRN